MYLSELDLVAITIALVTSIALIITSATANARLIRERNYWRKTYHNYKFATEAEAMGKPYSWNCASKTWQYTSQEKALLSADECECNGECGQKEQQ